MNLSMFLQENQTEAKEEIDCYGYSLKEAMNYQIQGDFKGAITHLENAIRSLSELEKMKNMKESYDQAQFLLNQLEGERQMNELKRKLGV